MPSAAPSGDPVAAVRKVESVAALLPAGGRASGTLRVGSSTGFPPGAYRPDGSDKPPAGLDLGIGDAVAKVLGVELQRQDASFETILPALGSGRYDVGFSDITVTEERMEKYDFAAYREANLAFEAKRNSGLKITGAEDVAGRTVAVSSGTNQEKLLIEWSKDNEKAGREPVDIKY